MISKQWERQIVDEAILCKSKARGYAADACWSLHARPREQEEEDHGTVTERKVDIPTTCIFLKHYSFDPFRRHNNHHVVKQYFLLLLAHKYKLNIKSSSIFLHQLHFYVTHLMI